MNNNTRRKFRIATTIVAMCLTLCIMVSGIWAATSLKFTGGNTLSFNAQDVSVALSGNWNYNGSSSTNAIEFTGGTLQDGKYHFDTSLNHGTTYSANVALSDFAFQKVTDHYALHITVENTFTDDIPIEATLTAAVSNDNNGYIAISVISNEGSNDINGTAKTIEQGSSVTFDVIISIAEDKRSNEALLENGFANIDFDFELDIVRATSGS